MQYPLPSSTYQQYSNDPFAHNPHSTSTLPPSTRQTQEDANAWAYAQQQSSHMSNNAAAHNPYHPSAAGGDPYHHHHQRDSGEYESYSSGGEDQQQQQPTHFSLSPSPHHHPQQSQPQPQQMYMGFPDLTSNGGGGGGPGTGAGAGASPYTGVTKASDLYASPSPAGTPYANPTTSDGRIPPGSGGGAYPSPYASPSPQGTGGSRLTPNIARLSIEQHGYSSSPLSPPGQGSQQAQIPLVSSNSGAATAVYGSSPGPSRNNTRMSPANQSTPGSGTSPYGRPLHHHGSHGHHHRYANHQHNPSNGSSFVSSTSSQQSQPSQQQQAQFSPSGLGDGRKIFAPNSVSLPPIGHPIEHHQQQPQQQPTARPKKEMVAGTPTHPDIPRPAIVAPPVPVPHLTKKSRGRQVPSVNSMGNAGPSVSVTSSHSSSRERHHDGGAGRERSYDGGLESPLSPHGASGGYFPGAQWSDSEYEDNNNAATAGRSGGGPVAHGHRSLFGQPPVPMDSYSNNTKTGGPGSTSTTSSPATSLSSRRTMEDAGPSNSTATAAAGGGPGALATGSLEAELRSRPFVCTVEGCGKAYIRAEHLKRHVRSIHTNDKREPSIRFSDSARF